MGVSTLISTRKLFKNQAIAKAGVVISSAIDIRNLVQQGAFSVYYTIEGTGTVKIEYMLCSERNGTYVTPSSASDIVSAAASGGAADILNFNPVIAPYMKIKLTENNVNPITSLNLWINFQ